MGQGGGKLRPGGGHAAAPLREVVHVLAHECDAVGDPQWRKHKTELAGRTLCLAARHVRPGLSFDDVLAGCRGAAAGTVLEKVLKKLAPKKLKECKSADPREVQMVAAWLGAASHAAPAVPLGDLLERAGINASRARRDAVVDAYSCGGASFVSFATFRKAWEAFGGHHEFEGLFAKYARGVLMDQAEFAAFLTVEQKEPGTKAAAVLGKYGVVEGGARRLSLTGFAAYLTSPEDNPLLSPLRASRVTDDMTQPLFSYFVSSSHNTYLTRGQLRGASSVDMYVHALMWGCRCVELDCWDGADGEPVIYHGYTKTSKIAFRDALVAIAEHAFVQSLYPVILSLEVHAGLAQQQKMARDLHDVLGDRIYTPAAPSDTDRTTNPLHELTGGVDMSAYPSPEALVGRFIVKGKRGKHGAPPSGTAAAGAPPLPLARSASGSGSELSSCSSDRGDNEAASEQAAGALARTNSLPRTRSWLSGRVKVHADLGSLIALPAAKNLLDPQVNLRDELALHGHGYRIISLSEGRLEGAAQGAPRIVAERSKLIITRVYPAATRINSTNFHPQRAWNLGVQMVAMNFQHTTTAKTDPLRLYLGRFRANGGCGYLLKPPPLRDPAVPWHDYGRYPPAALQLTVLRILPGAADPAAGAPQKARLQGLRKGYAVRVVVSGIPQDAAKVQVDGVGGAGGGVFSETLRFACYDMATVVLQVWTPEGAFVGESVLPASCIAHGHRVVPLSDVSMRPTQAALWIQAIWTGAGPPSDADLLAAQPTPGAATPAPAWKPLIEAPHLEPMTRPLISSP
eukprot:TRINITY_DN794_c0_g1_i1.p1 TRINITY_DN794_c0_g1~~TRINITY_DN794_c0_g1_i1.p1  ORF type:complete len:797 (+),score=233.74 TRINITY_DN794_c0_g1_i1:147-2537(+)